MCIVTWDKKKKTEQYVENYLQNGDICIRWHLNLTVYFGNVITDICAAPSFGVNGHQHHHGHMETLYRYCTISFYFISLGFSFSEVSSV